MPTLKSIESINLSAEPGVLIVKCTIEDDDGIEWQPEHCYRTDDPYGLNPHIGSFLEAFPDFPIGPYVPPEIPPPVVILYPVDLWTRVTDEEAEQIEAAMLTQPVRVQNIFKSASSYRSDHDLWPTLQAMATSLFGAERAAVILAAS